jgi:Tfp pilus assembly protein PilN
MRAVNLLPRDHTRPQRKSPLAAVGRDPLLPASVALAVLATAAVGFAAHSASSTVSKRNAIIRSLDQQLARVAVRDRHPSQGPAPSQATALATLTAQRTNWDGFLWSLSRVVPEDVWMLSLSAQASATSSDQSTAATVGSAAPTGFTVTGYTYSQPSVARVMRRLSLLPWLRDVSLVSSTKTAIANHTVFQFTVGANFVGLPAVGT